MSLRRLRWLLALPALAALHAAPAQGGNWPWDQAFMPPRGRIGVVVQSMTPELREHLGAPAARGLLVARVEPGRPGARGGIRVGDVIVSAAGAALAEPFDLVKAVGRVPAGEALELRVVRARQVLSLRVEPEGEAVPWTDADRWQEWVERHLQQGSQELRRQLEELQRQLEELEQQLDEEPEGDPQDLERT